jgi:ataxia telangiectasia mutated family protein
VLRVLRGNTLQLLTILKVVIHDPLYKWSLSPQDIRNRQLFTSTLGEAGGGNNVGKMNLKDKARAPQTPVDNNNQFGRDAGERTLLKIRAKLQGHEDPAGDGLSIHGQVEYLINEAVSIENLSKIFPGWAPYL